MTPPDGSCSPGQAERAPPGPRGARRASGRQAGGQVIPGVNKAALGRVEASTSWWSQLNADDQAVGDGARLVGHRAFADYL